MNTTTSYVVSFVLAITFHVAVVGLLLMNWEDDRTVSLARPQAYYIEATVVSENPLEAARKRKEKAAQEARRKLKLARQKKADQARLRQEAIARARKQELEKQLAQRREKEEQREQPAEPDVSRDDPARSAGRETGESEAERLRMEQSLALSVLEEQEYRRAVTDDEKAQAYVARIQQEIINNWSRPPSARNGMEALLRVFLVPTGEVVNVVVEESSGNEAFDRSALLAVNKAKRFQVPDDSRQFERNFREFTVLFRPEDLRL